MKKLSLLFTFLGSTVTFAQQAPKSEIWFAKDFQVALGFSNLLPNESMMGDTHRVAFPVIYARLGIFHFNQFTLGLHANAGGMKVKDSQYYGAFDNTSFYTIGPYVSFSQPISATTLLEPYISYDYSDYRSKYDSKKLTYQSDGLGLGMDYEFNASGNAFFTIGLKYSINKLRTTTNPNWEKYLNNHNFMSVKLGFTFAKNRL